MTLLQSIMHAIKSVPGLDAEVFYGHCDSPDIRTTPLVDVNEFKGKKLYLTNAPVSFEGTFEVHCFASTLEKAEAVAQQVDGAIDMQKIGANVRSVTQEGYSVVTEDLYIYHIQMDYAIAADTA